MLDRLERLRPARPLVRVVARIVHVPLVRPLGVEVQRPVVLIQQIPDGLLVLIRDRRPVRGSHPAQEDISWTSERVRRKRCVLVLSTGKVGHRAASAVRVELDGILERRPERGRVVGRPCSVGQEPAVRRGRCRVDGPRIVALARQTRYRRPIDLERTRRRTAPGRVVGDGFRTSDKPLPLARIERNRRSSLRRRHGFYWADDET